MCELEVDGWLSLRDVMSALYDVWYVGEFKYLCECLSMFVNVCQCIRVYLVRMNGEEKVGLCVFSAIAQGFKVWEKLRFV